MMKKFFALASMTAVAGVIAAGAMVGCSSSDDAAPGPSDDAGTTSDAKTTDAKADRNVVDNDAAPPPEEENVGTPCTADSDCEVADSAGDNLCSKGFLSAGGAAYDIFPTPVCVSGCGPINKEDINTYFCDGNAGVCFDFGVEVCVGGCQFTADAITTDCQGANNKCQPYLFGNDPTTKAPMILGACIGACTQDSDCKGTPGQKCQKEQGVCLDATLWSDYTGSVQGTACTKNADAAADTCLCATLGGSGANKDKGYCYSQCVTGATGQCGPNWTCSSHIPTTLELDDGGIEPWMTKVPTGVIGSCSFPCTTVADCNGDGKPFEGMAEGTEVACSEYADGKFCDLVTQK